MSFLLAALSALLPWADKAFLMSGWFTHSRIIFLLVLVTDNCLELQYSHSFVHSKERFGGGQLNTRNTLSHPAGSERSTGTRQGWQEGKVLEFLPVHGSACPGGPCITLYPSCT